MNQQLSDVAQHIGLTPEQLEWLQQQHITVLTPLHHSCEVNYVESIIKLSLLAAALNIKLDVHLEKGDSLITRARNTTTHRWLQTTSNIGLWIDSDIGFEAAQILQMIATKQPLIGAPYAKKQTDWNRYHAWLQQKLEQNQLPTATQLQLATANQWVLNTTEAVISAVTPVDELGTGLLCTHRQVYTTLQPHVGTYQTDVGNQQTQHNYWQAPVLNNRLLSEDYYFCALAKTHGYQPMLFLPANTTHCGTNYWQTSTQWQ